MNSLLSMVQHYNSQIETGYLLIMVINALLHILFAGAVARDAGHFHRLGLKPALVSPATWAFATLIGGVITASIYWFIHHSTLTRPTNREPHHDRT
jgi:hypothetical protein